MVVNHETATTKLKNIEREKTIFENEAFPFTAILAVIFIVGITTFMVLSKQKSNNHFIGVAAISGAVFYLSQFLKHQKQNS
jgi:L-asparagine transporter-like permease